MDCIDVETMYAEVVDSYDTHQTFQVTHSYDAALARHDAAPADMGGSTPWWVIIALTLAVWLLLRGVFKPTPHRARVSPAAATSVAHCRGCDAAHPGHARFCPHCGRRV